MGWHSNLPHGTTEAHIDALTESDDAPDILTERIDPPIPTSIKWQAWVDGFEENGCAYGETEEQAVEMLREMMEDW